MDLYNIGYKIIIIKKNYNILFVIYFNQIKMIN